MVIPPERYLIPAFVYSPAHIAPGQLDTLCSQIDLPPTLLALLGFTYQSSFFGRNILEMLPEEGRAYLGTYQLLGLLDRGSLVVLSPNRPPAVTLLNAASQARPEDNGPAIERAIAAYQTAQDFFSDGRLNRQQVKEAFFAPSALARN